MKKTYLLNLLDITKRQNVEIQKNEIDKFILLMQERQEIIDILEELNNQTGVSLNDEEKDILLEIRKIDEENKQEYYRQFEEVKTQLRQVRNMLKSEQQYMNIYEPYVKGHKYEKNR